MTQPAYINGPATFENGKPIGFIAANGTVAKVLLEPQVAAAAVTTLPPFYGGLTAIDITASSTDAAAKSVILWLGKILTTQDATVTGNITLSAQNKLTRAIVAPANWITEKWQIGDAVMIFAPPSADQVVAAIDGIVGIVTARTAADLTVNGTPWAAGANILVTGSRIVNVSQLFRSAITANAGNSDTIANVSLLNNSSDNTIVKTEQKLGADAMLIASMAAAVSALPALVSISARATARY